MFRFMSHVCNHSSLLSCCPFVVVCKQMLDLPMLCPQVITVETVTAVKRGKYMEINIYELSLIHI